MGIPTRFNPMGIRKKKSSDDSIVHFSCASYKEKAETGQTITYSNTSASNFVTFNGIPSYNTGSGRYARITEPTINQGTSMPRSYSVWLACTNEAYGNTNMRGIAIGSFSTGNELNSPNNTYNYLIQAGGYGQDYSVGANYKKGEWNHYVQTYDSDGTLKFYLNGVLKLTKTSVSFNINNTIMSLGAPTNSTNAYFNGYIAGARLYNKVLSQAEITTLSEEFTPVYEVTASDQSFSFYQKNESFSLAYSCVKTPTISIIEGELPSTITFSNGTFTGKGLTDDDHTYNLKIRFSGDQITTKDINVTLNTYKTARISMSAQSFTFTTEATETGSISYTSDESVTFAIDSGTLPTGVTLNGNTFTSDGTQSSAATASVVIKATSEHNQTGVTATMTLNVQLNVITISTSSLKFYVDQGETSKQIKYTTSKNSITPVYSMTGTLPTGVTFDSSTGSFTNDATQSAATSGTIAVTVASSTGCSTAATKNVDIIVEMVQTIPDDYVFFMTMTSQQTLAETGQTVTWYSTNGSDFDDGWHKSSTSTTNWRSTCSTWLPNATNRAFSTSYWIKLPTSSASTHNIESQCLVIGRYADASFSSKKGYYKTVFNFYTNSIIHAVRTEISDGRVTDYSLAGPTNVQICDGNWHHICFVYDGTTEYMYFDGSDNDIISYSSESAKSIQWYLDSNNISMGYFDYSSQQFSGESSTKYLRIYDRVLTASEITALSQEFTPTT